MSGCTRIRTRVYSRFTDDTYAKAVIYTIIITKGYTHSGFWKCLSSTYSIRHSITPAD